jgi:hypothetical protein
MDFVRKCYLGEVWRGLHLLIMKENVTPEKGSERGFFTLII